MSHFTLKASHRIHAVRKSSLVVLVLACVVGWRAPHRAVAREQTIVHLMGTVSDGATGRPVEGASVSATGEGISSVGTTSTANGNYHLAIPVARRGLALRVAIRRLGYTSSIQNVQANADTVRLNATLTASVNTLSAVTVTNQAGKAERVAYASPPMAPMTAMSSRSMLESRAASAADRVSDTRMYRTDSNRVDWNREQYDRINDNPFLAVRGNPRSTFSVDVDRASYGNVRRFIAQGTLPPADAVRIEELVNYFPYTLAAPKGDAPVAITTEVIAAPWQPRHQLVRVALQARQIETRMLPPSNLVFLIDVSGSMNSPDKLPLVKESLRLLVENLRDQDRVALVVYAGAAGLVLESTPGSEKARIMEAIDRLEAGGSTAGGAGLELAYRTARQNFERRANNRVILATDGDFNVGVSSDAAMERLIESKRAEGTYLTVLGFGTGNYQDAKMEKMAKVGNGNYAYVDDISEARKVLVKEMGATLVTVANDVKLQVEFNPKRVAGYRLIGYEDRLLRDEDFRDDKKDAGDMGAGHSVTALYEIVPVGVNGTVKLRGSDPLRYGAKETETNAGKDELLQVSMRYKRPGDSTSELVTAIVRAGDVAKRGSDDLRFASAVASFGMVLRNSEHKGTATGTTVLALARGATGDDDGGYRAEFIRMVERWQDISRGIAERPVRRDR